MRKNKGNFVIVLAYAFLNLGDHLVFWSFYGADMGDISHLIGRLVIL